MRTPRCAVRRGLAISLLALACAAAGHAQGVEVELEGLDGDPRRNALAALSIQEAATEKEGEEAELSEERIRRLHGRAPGQIRRAVEPFGYYRATVDAELTREGDAWKASYTVDPGPRIRIEELDVELLGEGADDRDFRAVVEGLPLDEGEALYHPDYEASKEALEEYAAETGYLDAGFETAEIRVDLDAYKAEVTLRYDTGIRYRFGEVRFMQNALKPELLRGYVRFEPGDPVSVTELLRLQNALADSPYFARVEVTTRPEEAEGRRVPVIVELDPAKRQRLTAGLGYGTDTGARGKAGIELRRINRSGHRGDAELKLSELETSAAARYVMPGAYPRTDAWTYTVGYAELSPETSDSRTLFAGVGRSDSRGAWREALSLNFRSEDFTVGVDRGTSNLLFPEATWSRVEADDRIRPSAGYRLQLEVRGAEESLLSDSTFLQLVTSGKAIESFGSRFRAIGRLRLGYTLTDDFRSLPPSIRFFAGGDESVRGYGYQELAPRDREDNPIGGEGLVVGSLELEAALVEKWAVAVFYDVGNALEEGFSGDLAAGTGAGLRWLSPIGPVRVDVAWALDEPGTPLRLHLSVGPDL